MCQTGTTTSVKQQWFDWDDPEKMDKGVLTGVSASGEESKSHQEWALDRVILGTEVFSDSLDWSVMTNLHGMTRMHR